jgi:hypothetical protein
VDIAPKQKTTLCERIAQLVRLFHTPKRGERANAWCAAERAMEDGGIDWRDVGNWIERGGKHDEGKYTESELQEYGQALRAEGIEAGIKIGMTRASSGSGNGHLTLPSLAEMADFCQTRRQRLKDDAQREFIDEMVVKTRNQMFLRNRLTPGTLAYLVSLYIKHGGKT